jgi:hypothetical protein
MIHSRNSRFYLLILLFTLIWGCAKVSAPAGGPKDKKSPVVVKSVPENGARNFRENKLVITFDEYVVLEKINDKFMVSPPMLKKPVVLIRGKSVVVEFEDTLKDSTTYTFNFQDAIRDLNEGNITDNFQFVFSTGKVIDSLSVRGNVYNAYNLEVPENTLVLLFRDLSDTSVIKQLPDYISRVNQNGSFRINNVREGKYRLYALKDNDNSKNYNLIEEEFAFLDDPVEITPENNFFPVIKDTTGIKSGAGATTDSILATKGNTLILFAAQKKAHYLTSSDRKMAYQLIYSLSLPPDSMKFEFSIPDNRDDKYFIERNKNNDTMRIWLTDSTLYSQPQITTVIRYPFTDTTGLLTQKDDTVLLRFLAPRPTRGKVQRVPLKVSNNIGSGNLKPGQRIFFLSQTPFKEPDTSVIRLYEIINENKVKVPFSLVKDTSNAGRYDMTAKLTEGKKYLFIADSAAFGNIYGDYSDSTGIKFSVLESKSFGKLVVNIGNVENNLIVQLLDKTDNLVREKQVKSNGKIDFPLLEKGFYRLRAVFDLNGDGKWTTGDFSAGIQPEPVTYYSTEIEVRTDWTVNQDWTIGEKNFKEQKLRDTKKK